MVFVFLLAYSCIVTPVSEELLFRGYIWNKWNKLNGISKSKWVTYLTVTILFPLWHLAYIDSIAFLVEDWNQHGCCNLFWNRQLWSFLPRPDGAWLGICPFDARTVGAGIDKVHHIKKRNKSGFLGGVL